MKLIILISILLLTSCATYRDIIADRMNSEAEVISHVRAECEHLNINKDKCSELTDAAVKLWNLKQYDLDSDSIKQYVISKIVQ